MIFEGNDNPLQYEGAYRKIFQCHYDMRLYPFDSQTCFVLKRLDESFVQLLPEEIDMKGDLELLQYIVLNWKITKHTSEDGKQGVRVKIVFGRKILNHVLTVYFPTFLIIAIVYSTNFFKDFFFEVCIDNSIT